MFPTMPQQQQMPPQPQAQGDASFRTGAQERLIQYIMRTQGVSREEAIRILQQRMAQTGGQAPPQTMPQRPPMG